ncbi:MULTISPECIES: GNAT family N-acetyltransferase [unclassified Neptuniibacter]|uniref:GNAT family N-acetyltransferase n=1 Tax=unclassified Neptuniibacter TaxID=2630693 RepID=UPI000C4011F9|nr:MULTISPECIES: GNAT family N-acetyltransferase [unclassified Neptuniibacter]MAY43627.1 GNAT family N-acetyltransferase [Oceanospirillaceae bacterium]|tara:strand:- start:15203 stop:15658 length:456 start_codon:yes stop_codon:yes gene_type:complete
MNIKRVSIAELDDLVTLFDQYMVFYKQPSALQKHRDYLNERLANDEASVFIAYNVDEEPAGFVLNYHTFSSVSLGKVIVLNDLFVVPSHRQQGIANSLINCSIELAKSTGSIRVDLATAHDNLSAQALYEKMGFIKDTEYFSYSLPITCAT